MLKNNIFFSLKIIFFRKTLANAAIMRYLITETRIE